LITTQRVIGQTVHGIAMKRFIVTQIEQFAHADFVGRKVVSCDVECRQRQLIFFVLWIESFGFEQLLLVPNQIVPDERNVTSQGVIICRFFAWRRHGIKCFARVFGITESNGTMRPGSEITLSVAFLLNSATRRQHSIALRKPALSAERAITRVASALSGLNSNTRWASRPACL